MHELLEDNKKRSGTDIRFFFNIYLLKKWDSTKDFCPDALPAILTSGTWAGALGREKSKIWVRAENRGHIILWYHQRGAELLSHLSECGGWRGSGWSHREDQTSGRQW